MATQITSQNIEELSATGKLIVVDFWATWCGPCQRLTPIVEELAAEYEGKAIIGKCNVDEDEDLPMQYKVRNIPVLIFLKGGQLVDKIVGLESKDKIKAIIEKNL